MMKTSSLLRSTCSAPAQFHLIFESCPSLSVPLWIPFRDRLKSFPQPLTMVFSVYEELSLLDSEYGASGREGYMPKVEHCEKLGSNLSKGYDA